jgi:RNA polymerase sigma-70 factor (ECF subfamily)
LIPPSAGQCGYAAASDEHLMCAAGGGDARAFDEVVNRHQKPAWNLAFRFLGDVEEARDVVQEAFLRIWDAAPRYRPTALFRTYLFRIVSRLCLDSIRRKRPVPMVQVPEPVDSTPTQIEDILMRERAEAVRRALVQLPARQRMAVVMRYYENCGYKEIAEALEVTEKAAERLLVRGRKALGILLMEWMRE